MSLPQKMACDRRFNFMLRIWIGLEIDRRGEDWEVKILQLPPEDVERL